MVATEPLPLDRDLRLIVPSQERLGLDCWQTVPYVLRCSAVERLMQADFVEPVSEDVQALLEPSASRLSRSQ